VETQREADYSLLIFSELPGSVRRRFVFEGIVPFSKESRVMRKRQSWWPQFEGLEAMTLLSGMGGGAHQALESLAKTAALPNPLPLTGTISGTLTMKANGDFVKAAGKLSPVGRTAFSGPEPSTLLTGGVSNLTIPGSLGKLFISVNLTPAGTTLSGTYTITGGTKALAGETGTGNLNVTVSSLASPIHFNATFG
jgi:hypothetical protein